MAEVSRVLIVDDHPLFREALHSAVNVACPGSEIREATSIADAVAMINATELAFDLVLLDLTIPGTEGFEGLLEVRARFPELPVVIVSSFEDTRIVQQALSYGAAGYVPKSSTKAEIASAITEVMAGAVHLPQCLGGARPALSGDACDDLLARLAALTPQQLRVLQMLRLGLLNKQIAHELDVCERTVKAHVSEILRKLGVYSRTQVVIETAKIDFEALSETLPPRFSP
ncbi:response regulator transcription factor [Xanthobacter autotrophicus]|uniref:response regulator transcription factor n=1 Tax=Xanthobacter TaxID=279 RepID=UPI0024AA148A|nr:response regulator transcription factor [Xanthobacter autotrophicus]MDI4664274.1 response regulator transcription factor [Xanthobacter autotrophicus]